MKFYRSFWFHPAVIQTSTYQNLAFYSFAFFFCIHFLSELLRLSSPNWSIYIILSAEWFFILFRVILSPILKVCCCPLLNVAVLCPGVDVLTRALSWLLGPGMQGLPGRAQVILMGRGEMLGSRASRTDKQ